MRYRFIYIVMRYISLAQSAINLRKTWQESIALSSGANKHYRELYKSLFSMHYSIFSRFSLTNEIWRNKYISAGNNSAIISARFSTELMSFDYVDMYVFFLFFYIATNVSKSMISKHFARYGIASFVPLWKGYSRVGVHGTDLLPAIVTPLFIFRCLIKFPNTDGP